MKGTIYMIPNYLGESKDFSLLPKALQERVTSINYFVVEELRSARRLIKSLNKAAKIEELNFSLLNEHSAEKELTVLIQPALDGHDIGIISEAGCPGIADPGADLVKLAHEKGIKVIPLTGPSSILLSLMASGLNGQSFSFEGYLPKEQQARIRKLKELDQSIHQSGETRIFIETPYRNNHLLQDILSHCNNKTRLCIASNLQDSSESIVTKTISSWKKQIPDLNKKPTVFLLGR